jgi:hypothetical protein
VDRQALNSWAHTKVEELSDFNESAAAGPSTPRNSKTDQYEDEYDSEYEELPHILVKHMPILE